jgi:predicted dehydrogenase
MTAFSGAVALPWVIPSSTRGAGGDSSPSERIAVGLIGKGIMGSGHLRRLVGDRDVQVLAVCDVDRVRREDGKQLAEQTYAAQSSSGTYRGCAAYNDYRE